MKLSKEELKKKIDEKIEDEDLKIELLEDIEDSVDVSDDTEKVEKTAYDEVVAERDEIKRKYKERFLSPEEVKENTEESEENTEESEEKTEESEEIIDVKEI